MPIGIQMTSFVTATRTSASTQYTYAKTLRALAHRLGSTSTPVLDMVISGLRVSSNATPPEQAVPATPQQMQILMGHAWQHDSSGKFPLALWIMWKTASRADDMRGLTKKSILLVDNNNNQVVIEWGDLKTNRQQRYRNYSLTVLQEDTHPATLNILQGVLRRMKADDKLFVMSTTTFRRWMQSFPQTRSLTAHSIKRGAINILAQHAAEGRFDPRLLAVVAKHQDPLHAFPSTTLRYVTDKIAMARMMRTQDATRWL